MIQKIVKQGMIWLSNMQIRYFKDLCEPCFPWDQIGTRSKRMYNMGRSVSMTGRAEGTFEDKKNWRDNYNWISSPGPCANTVSATFSYSLSSKSEST